MIVRPSRLLLILAWLALSPGAFAGELSRVDRTLSREPPYRSTPRYCLLVFGAEAKTRVWLVQDGDTLYVDRNGNGDLTEAGKKVTPGKAASAAEGDFIFEVGEVHDGQLTHRNLTVSVRRM